MQYKTHLKIWAAYTNHNCKYDLYFAIRVCSSRTWQRFGFRFANWADRNRNFIYPSILFADPSFYIVIWIFHKFFSIWAYFIAGPQNCSAVARLNIAPPQVVVSFGEPVFPRNQYKLRNRLACFQSSQWHRVDHSTYSLQRHLPAKASSRISRLNQFIPSFPELKELPCIIRT